MYDHIEKALTRLYWQYKNSPKFIELIKSIPKIAQCNIEDQASKIANIIDIETANGEWLDICGRIIGFNERPTYKLGASCQPKPVTDDIFRSMIKAKIHKNNSYATIDDVKIAVDHVLNTNIRVLDGQDMSMRLVWFEEGVSDVLIKILVDYDLMPRPQGVSLKEHRVITYIPFGFGRYNRNFGNASFWKGDGLNKYRARIKLAVTDSGKITGYIVATEQLKISDIDITIKITDVTGSEQHIYTVTDENGHFSTDLNYGIGDFSIIAKAQLITPLCEVLNITSNSIKQTIQTHAYYVSEDVQFQFITENNEYLLVESKRD